MDKQIGLEKYAGKSSWNLPSQILIDFPPNLFLIQYGLWISLKSPIILNVSI